MEPRHHTDDILWFDSLESTNRTARELSGSLDNLSVLAAREQTAGRGQGSHGWTSAPGENLTFSVLFRPLQLDAADILLLTCAVTLGIRDYLFSKDVKARIKWPNDIWVADRKICGILIENRLDAGLVAESIIGIGFNLNQQGWPPEIPNPVSLRLLTGKEYKPETELHALACRIRERLRRLDSGKGAALQEEFLR
ncbi:MAG: biotin--[Bacteroidales bacterium]|nr:biotin--[acetyl-CoA-carboxylase] ligase [Bacteroidales bacterium]